MKKILSAIFVLIIITSAAASCGSGAAITASEAEEIFKPLIEASHELNVIYFGEGLKCATDEELASDESELSAARIAATNVSYAAISSESKYQTQAEIIEATEKVFSESYASELYSIAFEGFAHDFESDLGLDGLTVYARYIENYGILTVLRSPNIMYTGREFNYSTLTVEKSDSNYIIINIDTTSPNGDIIPARIRAIKESGKWKLDSPTY